MTAASTVRLSLSSTVRWLAGPIFDKELRAASRRRRSYVLRFVYVGLLTALMAGVWLAIAADVGSGSMLYQVSRNSAAGRYIMVALVWFQFIAAQLAAVMLLGDAIRSEVRKRTLHVLAVTPLSGLQIVAGKLAGGLLPVVMLLATSLPLLALVRVLGGVPWDYIVSGVSITFSAMVFAGALHVLVSVPRRSVLGTVGPALWFGLLTRIPDGLVGWFALTRPMVGTIGVPILRLISPTNVLLARTREMLTAQPGGAWPAGWPLHCLVLLAASVFVLLLAARRVRTVASEPVSDRTPRPGTHKSSAYRGEGTSRAGIFLRRQIPGAGPIRRVQGSPVLWKELRTSGVLRSRHFLGRYGASAIVVCLIVAAAIGVGIFGVGSSASLLAGGMVLCAMGLHVGVVVGLSGAAAMMIPKEREAGTLAVLLATPLGAGHIVRDKALAVLRQSLPVLMSLFVFLFFSLVYAMASTVSRVRPLVLVYGVGFYLASMLGIVPLFTGLGLYCGVRFKTTVAARGCTFAVVLVSVMILCCVVIPLTYSIVWSGSKAWLLVPVVVVGAALACAGLGLAFLYAAARRLRRQVF